jgi:hypothetical protein
LQAAGLGDGGVQNIRWAVDSADTSSNPSLQANVPAALRRVFGAFAILMTPVGMPISSALTDSVIPMPRCLITE